MGGVSAMISTIFRLLLTGSLLLSGTEASSVDYYVATNGSDSNVGTLAQPFATMERAPDEVRRTRQADLISDVNVYFREGTYRIYETVVLGLEDGSEAQRSTVIFSTTAAASNPSHPRTRHSTISSFPPNTHHRCRRGSNV